MSRRDQIRMTDAEISAFLDQQRSLQVASINKDGTPHLVTMWYGFVDGNIVFWTYAKSQKVANLRRDPRISCLVESGLTYEELKGVSITGRGELSDDREFVLQVGAAVLPRYNMVEIDDGVREVLQRMGAKRVAITIHPSKIVSWDHAKLGGVY
jgi:PPOX class probable F420-dependent enzyme